jgi:teichuronic acid biosynthesis glycosyltransferase TuaG
VDIKYVDVILPNFNKEKYLKEAIESVINQSYKYWKLYIIDDCSDDNSINILNNYKNYKNIIIKKLSKNKGPSFCRNLGLRISSAEYVAFIDSDDYWTQNKLSSQISFMIKNNYKFTFTDYTPFLELINEKKFLKSTNINNKFNLEKFTLNSSINTTTMILSRLIIKDLKFKKIKKLEDYLFKCEILKKGFTAHKLNANSAYYRILKTSRSSDRIKNIYYLWQINKKYLNYNFFNNLYSVCMISINSIRKYGFK